MKFLYYISVVFITIKRAEIVRSSEETARNTSNEISALPEYLTTELLFKEQTTSIGHIADNNTNAASFDSLTGLSNNQTSGKTVPSIPKESHSSNDLQTAKSKSTSSLESASPSSSPSQQKISIDSDTNTLLSTSSMSSSTLETTTDVKTTTDPGTTGQT